MRRQPFRKTQTAYISLLYILHIGEEFYGKVPQREEQSLRRGAKR